MPAVPKTPPYLIHNVGSAALWMMPAPTFSGGLASTLKRCADLRISHLLSLIEPHEAQALGLEGLHSACLANDIELQRTPMVDRQPPESLDEFLNVSTRLYQCMSDGESVGIHCKSGIGRSGMHICALLGKLDFGLQDALKLIQLRRGLKAPNTSEQLDWLEEHWDKISAL